MLTDGIYQPYFKIASYVVCLEVGYIYAIAWASALSVLTIRAMREPRIVRWAREDSHAIFLFSLKTIA